MKHPETEDFLKEGYTHFPRSYSAVMRFIDLVHDRVERCLEQTEFEELKTNPDRRRKKESGGSADEGMWIYVYPHYHRGEAKVAFEVGLRWDTPGLEASMIAYLRGHLNKEPFPIAGYVPTDKRLRCDRLIDRFNLYMPLDGTQDPFEAIGWLLAEAERAIAALR